MWEQILKAFEKVPTLGEQVSSFVHSPFCAEYVHNPVCNLYSWTLWLWQGWH